MKLILLSLLYYLISSQNTNRSYVKQYSYSFLSTEFLKLFPLSIVVLKGKTNITKCFAAKDIKINETIFEFQKKEIISNINSIHANLEKITSIIKKYVNDTYLQNKFLLSFFIYHVMTNPYNISDIDSKLRLFILYLPVEEINPIELLVNKSNIEENLIKKEWLEFKNDDEVDIINKIIEEGLDIDSNNKTDENYILFGQIYYFVKITSFNLNGNAIVLPFLDSCGIIPYYLHKEINTYDSIFLEENENKIIVKSKLDILQSEQFVFSFDIPLTNDYLLLTQGKVILNNINDRYIIKKSFSFENDSQLGSFLLKMNLRKEDFEKIKLQRKSNTRFASFNFELFPNKINEYILRFSDIYYNNNMSKKFFLIIKMCYDELKDILKIIKDKFNSNTFEDYLLKIQNQKEISESNNAIMNFNLAKIGILQKNVNLAFQKLVKFNIKEINDLKLNYL